MTVKAIIADDEKELRTYMRSLLAETWPDLIICGEAANGEEALELVESRHPQVAFLDIRMPGLSGMDVARRIAGACHIVFVTAYDRYAVEAFEREAVDYLLKPVSKERLLQTIQRLQERIEAASSPAPHVSEVVQQLLSRLPAQAGRDYLRWIKTQHRDSVRLIPVEEIDYFKADDKYTLVMTKEGESLIRKSIRELAEELDPAQFWQVHRGTIVNVSRIDRVSHSLTGRGILKLKERPELLTVSRNYLHLFKHMWALEKSPVRKLQDPWTASHKVLRTQADLNGVGDGVDQGESRNLLCDQEVQSEAPGPSAQQRVVTSSEPPPPQRFWKAGPRPSGAAWPGSDPGPRKAHDPADQSTRHPETAATGA